MTINSTQISRKYVTDRIKSFYESSYADKDIGIVETVLNNVIDLFDGKREGFQRCDAQYHNLTHTLQTIPPFVDIIEGWNKSGNTPKVSKEFFSMGIIAVLLHDTGYIKKKVTCSAQGQSTPLSISKEVWISQAAIWQRSASTDKGSLR